MTIRPLLGVLGVATVLLGTTLTAEAIVRAKTQLLSSAYLTGGSLLFYDDRGDLRGRLYGVRRVEVARYWTLITTTQDHADEVAYLVRHIKNDRTRMTVANALHPTSYMVGRIVQRVTVDYLVDRGDIRITLVGRAR